MVWTRNCEVCVRNSKVWMPWNDGNCYRINWQTRLAKGQFTNFSFHRGRHHVIYIHVTSPSVMKYFTSYMQHVHNFNTKKYQYDDSRWMVVYFLLSTSVPVYGRLHALIFHVKSATAAPLASQWHNACFLWTAPNNLVWGPSLPPRPVARIFWRGDFMDL